MNKINQAIYDNTKPIEWTIEELKKRVRNADAINNYYQTDPHAFDFTDTETENLKDGNREEKWRTCKSSDAICQMNGIDETKYEIQASDFGRVRLRIKNKDEWDICPLYEKDNRTQKLNKSVLKNLIERHKKGEEVKIGYLIAKNRENGKFLDLHVYCLVADAWLEDYTYNPYNKTNKQIHHITNDGYDNSPENLIVLDDSTHSMIPKNGEKDDLDYHPRRIVIS